MLAIDHSFLVTVTELAGLAGCLGFGSGLGWCVMGGPDSNRDLCKIGNWVGILRCAGYYYAFGQYRDEKISFVEMSWRDRKSVV